MEGKGKEQALVPVDYENQRVMTSVQVAHGLGCSFEVIRANFKNHKELYVEGVHYFKLTGEALRRFRSHVNSIYEPQSPFHISKYASILYLWTCQGVARHSKLIDTPEAWALFTELENAYFKPAPPAETPAEPAETPELPPVENSLFEPVDDFRKFSAAARRLAGAEFKRLREQQVKTPATPAEPDLARAELLIALADKFHDESFKDKTLCQAVNLICGRDIF